MKLEEITTSRKLPKCMLLDPTDSYGRFSIIEKAKALGLKVRVIEVPELPTQSYYGFDEEVQETLYVLDKVLAEDAKKVQNFLSLDSDYLLAHVGASTVRSKAFNHLPSTEGVSLVEKEEIKPWEMVSWLTARLREKGVAFEKGAVEVLVQYIGTDLVRMETEIKKLLTLDPGGISISSIKTTVYDSSTESIYPAIETLLLGNYVEFFTRIRKSNEPLMVCRMLRSECEILSKVGILQAVGTQLSEMQEILGIKTFVISSRYLSKIDKISRGELFNLIAYLSDVENRMLKPNLNVDPWILIESAVLESLKKPDK